MSSEIQKKLRLDDRFSWSFAGVILALFFGAFALYSYFHQVRANVVFEIESQSDVFDLHRPLQDLAVSFRGQDIQQQDLNVRILTVRIANRGGVDILQGFYDQQDPWGIRVQPGQVIEVRVGQNNSTYLGSHLDPRITAPDTITLNKVIFERDKFTILDILVLHHKGNPPHIRPFGKIAGINEISVVDASAQGTKPAFWEQVVSGSPFVHVVRFTGYVLTLIIGIVLIAGLVGGVSDIRGKRRRHRIREVFDPTPENKEAFESLEELYVRRGLGGLESLAALLGDRKELKAAVTNPRAVSYGPEMVFFDGGDFVRHGRTADGEIVLFRGPGLRDLIRKGLIKRQGQDDVTVDPQLHETLEQLIDKLK